MVSCVHILEREKTLELVTVYNREGENFIIWIMRKFISKVLEREFCETERNERKDFSLNKFTQGSLGTSLDETPKVGDLSLNERSKINLGTFWFCIK